jgi:hypothetical protein
MHGAIPTLPHMSSRRVCLARDSFILPLVLCSDLFYFWLQIIVLLELTFVSCFFLLFV